MKETSLINYSEEEKNLEWICDGYYFLLPKSINKLLEVDKKLQISANQARMDLILEKQILSMYVEKDGNCKLLILLTKNEEGIFVLNSLCSHQKSCPSSEERIVLGKWCVEKHIVFSFSLKNE